MFKTYLLWGINAKLHIYFYLFFFFWKALYWYITYNVCCSEFFVSRLLKQTNKIAAVREKNIHIIIMASDNLPLNAAIFLCRDSL